jgi:hypothetical protein
LEQGQRQKREKNAAKQLENQAEGVHDPVMKRFT